MNKLGIKRSLLALLCVLAIANIGQACPTCKEALSGGAQTAGMAEGYFWSILFMMSMPFLILGGLGGYFYLQIRAARSSPSLAASEHVRRPTRVASPVETR
jgi:hypothetical protein